jgi:DNA-directed RNA polymerase alpha subunit/DNA-directed RNA polymerase subunit L
MNPFISHIDDNGENLQFTLSGVNVSIANALRRTILSDIPTVVFKTLPYEENKANIIVNTSRLNNEIIKQRLSCIPIHIPNYDKYNLQDYMLEVNVENTTDETIFVTTQHFKIKNITTNTYLSDADTISIFPPNNYTGYFIDFVRLRPKLSDDLMGEKIHLTCEFSLGTAKEDGMFNVVSTSSYGFTQDLHKMHEELDKKVALWKKEDKTKEEIDFEKKNWALLDGLRITVENSFDFIIESVGVYSNTVIVHKACDIIISRVNHINELIEQDLLVIKPSINTLENSYDIILENEDYTIGKLLEFILYNKFYEGTKMLSFCGFKKLHPHDTYSIIRVAYRNNIDIDTIKINIKEIIEDAKNIFYTIQKHFPNKLV